MSVKANCCLAGAFFKTEYGVQCSSQIEESGWIKPFCLLANSISKSASWVVILYQLVLLIFSWMIGSCLAFSLVNSACLTLSQLLAVCCWAFALTKADLAVLTWSLAVVSCCWAWAITWFCLLSSLVNSACLAINQAWAFCLSWAVFACRKVCLAALTIPCLRLIQPFAVLIVVLVVCLTCSSLALAVW